jgi:drug/metabolite transporter (DMT)-like permease
VTLACARLLIAVLVLSPLLVRDLRRHRVAPGLGLLRPTLWPGVALGVHLVVWNAGARMTAAANASLVVNMVPLATPLLLWVIARERLNRGEWLGTALGLAGIVLLTGRDYELDRAFFAGDAVCLLAMLLFALYLVLGRKRQVATLWLYVVPLYAVAAFTCLVACLLVEEPLAGLDEPREIVMALGLALVPTVLGHSSLNHAMQALRGQVVSVANLCQPLSAALLALLLLDEVPRPAFYGAALLILAGAALALGVRLPATGRS